MSDTDNNKTATLEITLANLKEVFTSANDVKYKSMFIHNRKNLPVTLIYVDGLVNQQIINENIIRPLSLSPWYESAANMQQAYDLTLQGGVQNISTDESSDMEELLSSLLSGNVILLFDSLKKAISMETKSYPIRGVTQATEENTYKSSKESLIENLRSNTGIIRRYIKSSNLAVEETTVGRQTNTRVAIIYLKNICNDSYVITIKNRLNSICTDNMIALKDIYSSLVDNPYSLFPHAKSTEKPDVVSASIVEGKVAVLIDDMPYALLFPTVFGDLMQAPMDYNMNYKVATFFRIIRYICFFGTLLIPGFFVAATQFHPEIIPYSLAVSIAAAKAGTPYGTVVEILVMTFAFYVLLQASMQIPMSIGSAISIVGGLVLGQAAITAKLVSPAVIIAVAAAAICSLAIPDKEANSATWLWQIIIVILSSILGLFGMVLGWLLLILALANQESLGVPYLAPFAGVGKVQLQDAFVRFPVNKIKFRPLYLRPKDDKRRP